MAKLMSTLLAVWVSSGFVARGESPAEPTDWSSGISAFCVDPVSTTTLYAGTGSFSGQGVGVLKSTNGGATWTRLSSGLTDKDVDAIAVDPKNPLNIYVGTPAGQGLYKSTDGGITFKRCNKGAEAEMSSNGVINIVIDPTNSQVVYAEVGTAGMGGGVPEAWYIYKSTNGGVSWTEIYSFISVDYDFLWPGLLAVDPKNSQNLYLVAAWLLDDDNRRDILKSTDGGRSWKKISNIAIQETDFCVSLVVDPKTSSRLFCSFNMSGAFRSLNSGKTWIKMPIPSNAVGNIVLSPSSPNVLYIGTDEGTYKSTNGGKSWKKLCADPGSMFMEIDPKAAATVYSLGEYEYYSCMYKSVNGGTSWQRIPIPLEDYGVCQDVIDCGF